MHGKTTGRMMEPQSTEKNRGEANAFQAPRANRENSAISCIDGRPTWRGFRRCWLRNGQSATIFSDDRLDTLTPFQSARIVSLSSLAPSPSGKAADCKSAIPGSNPGGAFV